MSKIVICKNVIPILNIIDEVREGDYVWMDWENIPKRGAWNGISCPGNFNGSMMELKDTIPRQITRIYTRGRTSIHIKLENVTGDWSYEIQNHLPWMYILKNYEGF